MTCSLNSALVLANCDYTNIANIPMNSIKSLWYWCYQDFNKGDVTDPQISTSALISNPEPSLVLRHIHTNTHDGDTWCLLLLLFTTKQSRQPLEFPDSRTTQLPLQSQHLFLITGLESRWREEVVLLPQLRCCWANFLIVKLLHWAFWWLAVDEFSSFYIWLCACVEQDAAVKQKSIKKIDEKSSWRKIPNIRFREQHLEN